MINTSSHIITAPLLKRAESTIHGCGREQSLTFSQSLESDQICSIDPACTHTHTHMDFESKINGICSDLQANAESDSESVYNMRKSVTDIDLDVDISVQTIYMGVIINFSDLRLCQSYLPGACYLMKIIIST